MAKKSRTPQPPRRPVQAPKTRTSAPDPDAVRRRRLIVIGAAAVAVFAAAVAGALYLFTDSGSGAGGQAAIRAVCSLRTYPETQAYRPGTSIHVETAPKRSAYNSFPPASGQHHSVPVPWGEYTEEIEQFRLVHNLEHGGIVIQYGRDVPEAQIEALLDWYRDDPNGKVVAPLPELGKTIALTAWNADPTGNEQEQRGKGVLARCPRFDEDAFDAFTSAYRYQGPEPVDPSNMDPGE